MPSEFLVRSTPEFTSQLREYAGENFAKLDEAIQFLLSRQPRKGVPIDDNIRYVHAPDSSPLGRAVIFYEFDGEAVFLRELKVEE